MTTKINIEGQDREFGFGLGFLGDMLEGLDLGFIELSNRLDSNPFKYIPLAMLYSYNSVNEPKIDNDTLLQWLENDGGMHSNALKEFREGYVKSMTKNVPVSASKKKIVKI
jgi:hypothetical protein